jgi:RNA polymerase sigma-70 factor (ECF subfamily)
MARSDNRWLGEGNGRGLLRGNFLVREALCYWSKMEDVVSEEIDTDVVTTRLDDASDEQLYSLLGSVDAHEAFRIMYLRHASHVYAYCARMLGDGDEAQDAFQETFIRLYRTATGRSTEMRVVPFLFTIARNQCISSIRARKATVSPEHCLMEVDARSYEDRERIELMRAAIDALPLAYREPLLLREYNGLSYADIAGILALPVSTVKIRIFRAKEKLHTRLAPIFEDV